MYTFKNTILVVAFNFSDCTHNKEYLQRLYGSHFKHIIFYSDYPESDDSSIHYIHVNKGCNMHNIFYHLYTTYRELIEESDGIFYTMDDNIINLNILDLLSTDKIIYNYSEVKTLDNYSGWHWDNSVWGKSAIYKLLNDDEFKLYNIDKFSGGFSDWFYLPKKYLIDKLFDLFRLFAKHNVFLELAIPSIINNIELDKSAYHCYTFDALWGNDRNRVFDKSYVYKTFNHKHNLILHPIKFNQHPDSKDWLIEFFHKDKCVIITTINKPTEAIMKHINNPDYDVIIVGDTKTPTDYYDLPCIYLDAEHQKKLFPELSELLPYNHYCRKNLGYLYAIKKGYSIIYETDDDNIPYNKFDNILHSTSYELISDVSSRWINIFKYFTNNAHIWPRGFPLNILKNDPSFLLTHTDKTPSIINGLVENDPDVDALFRLICKHEKTITWDTNKKVMIDNNNLCVFNTQNTFWLNSLIFTCMFIPTTVSFRYCDILRGIIANIILKRTNNYMIYSSPNVVQIRNEHNLMSDFKSEYEMYIHNETILNYIEDNLDNITSIKDIMTTIYNNLLEHNIISKKDVDILHVWLSYF